MPVMRSFGSFAATPNLGANYTAGFSAGGKVIDDERQGHIAREKMANDAAMAANQIATQSAIAQQKLQQEAVQSKMEIAAKQEMFQQETMRKGQEMEMEKAYRDQLNQLKSKELEQQKQVDQIKIQQAIRQQDAMEKYKKDMSSGVLWDERDPQNAARDAALANPDAFSTGAEMSAVIRPPGGYGSAGGAGFEMPEGGVNGVPIHDDKGNIIGYQVQTGRNNSQVVRTTPEITLPDSMQKTHSVAGGKVYRNVDSLEVDRTEAALKVAEKALEGMKIYGPVSVQKVKDGSKDPKVKRVADSYLAAQSEVNQLKGKIGRLTGEGEEVSTPAPSGDKLPEGKRGFSRKLGKPVIVKDGKWVIDQ